MKQYLTTLTFCLILTHLLSAADTIYLTSGRTMTGEIQRIDGDVLRFSIETAAGKAGSALPLNQVKSIDFGHRSEVESLMSNLSGKNADDLRPRWEKLLPFLSLAESSSGEIGLMFARLLLSGENEQNIREALQVARQIQKEDWNEARRDRAGEMVIEIEISLGSAGEIAAKTEAWLQGDDPAKRVTASYIRAQGLIAEYKTFLEQNPRWQLDPEARQFHEETFHRIFDLLLVPSLQYGLTGERAARSLWEMTRFYDILGDTRNALSVARDLVEIYPQTSFRGLAEKYIKENPADS
jgi:hypothetical protein